LRDEIGCFRNETVPTQADGQDVVGHYRHPKDVVADMMEDDSMRPPATRPARDVKPPPKVRNCTICRHMPLPVRATLTGVTMRSTRRNSVCNQDWINNDNPCTPPCCVCGLWSTASWVNQCKTHASSHQLVVAG
jgi:hypothetical protein